VFDRSPLAWYNDENDFKINNNLVHIEYGVHTQYFNPSLSKKDTIKRLMTKKMGGDCVLDTSRAPKRFVPFLYSPQSALRRGIRCINRNRTNELIVKEMLLDCGTNAGQELYDEYGCTKNGLFFFT
jgi:hypothetical protein